MQSRAFISRGPSRLGAKAGPSFSASAPALLGAGHVSPVGVLCPAGGLSSSPGLRPPDASSPPTRAVAPKTPPDAADVLQGAESPRLRTTNFTEKTPFRKSERRLLPEAQQFPSPTHWPRRSEATTAPEAPAGIRGLTFRVSTAEPSAPQETTGAAYGAVRRAGAHFVPSGVPAHLEDAAGASVAVDETSALQSKATVTRDAERRRGPPGCRHRNVQT